MPNDIFKLVVDELDMYIGDILAFGMTKKALQRVGATPDNVNQVQMAKALSLHIKPNLAAFMTPDASSKLIRNIETRIRSVN